MSVVSTLEGITNKMGSELSLPAIEITGSYDVGLVVLSYLIAALASYTALDLIATLKADPELKQQSPRRLMWQFGAAVALGGGIWAVHFISLLAFRFHGDTQVDYASSFIGLSLAVTVALAFLAVYLITHISARKRYVISGGVLAGLAMAAMHYTGMEALKIEAVVSYDTRTFIAALLLSMGLAVGALWIGRAPHTCRGRHKWLAAGLLGAAICTMHYLSMYGTSFIECPTTVVASMPPSPHFLAVEISIMTLLIVGLALTLSTSTRNKTEMLKVQYSDMRNEIEQRRRTEAELRDLNDRLKQTMDKLVESEKLASIGQLAAGVAHEINNPVGYINANMETLRQSLANLFTLLDTYEQTLGDCPEHKKSHKAIMQLRKKMDFDYLREDLPILLEECMQGLLRVKTIIQDLRTFSHVDRKTFELTDVNRLVDTTINIIGSSKYRQGTITRKLAKIPPVQCVPQQIEQVLLNLVVNALHAIDKNPEGRIIIETRHNPDEKTVTLVVHDNGIGIPPEHIKRLYDPFFTTKKIGEGTGLGLSISYNIVRDHNGRIAVQSEVGKGTIFTVTLPISQPDRREQIS